MVKRTEIGGFQRRKMILILGRGRSHKDGGFQDNRRAVLSTLAPLTLLKPWNSRLGRDSVSWRGSENYCSSPFIHGEHNFSPLHCTDRSWAGREQHKVLDSFHIEPLASGSMTTNATAAFSEASGKGTLERDFRDSFAGSPSVIELGTGGSRKSTAQVRPFPQRLQTKKLLWSVSQPIRSKEKLKVRGKGLLFN